ncbi:MAG: PTS sugar transporter subunit IIA [Beijerinckiaceae bacterium]
MRLDSLLAADAILPSLKANTRKQALAEVAALAARVSGLKEREIFDNLWQRECLGSTGVGEGIALPHAKMGKAGRMFGVFARLERPIEYDSLDGVPVDLVFALIAPETAGADHLQALAQVARTFRDDSLVAALRATRDSAGLFTLLTSPSALDAA